MFKSSKIDFYKNKIFLLSENIFDIFDDISDSDESEFTDPLNNVSCNNDVSSASAIRTVDLESQEGIFLMNIFS